MGATIVVIDKTTPGTFTQIELERMVWACRYQALYHFNRSPWVEHEYAPPVGDVQLLAADAPIPAGAWIAELLDSTGQEGALGFHEDQVFDNTLEGQPSSERTSVRPRKASMRSARGITLHPETGEEVPLIKIGCQTSRQDGVQPSEVLSHEILESAVDPRVMNEAEVRKFLNAAKGEYFIAEICDPVQGRGYDVGAPEHRPCGVPEATVADYVDPSWFEQPQTRPYTSFCEEAGLAPRIEPWEVNPHDGYISVQPEAGGSWTQIFGDAQSSSASATPAAEDRRHSNRELLELLHNIDWKVETMSVTLTNLEAAVTDLATAEQAIVSTVSDLEAEVAKLNTGEAPTQEQVDAITSKVQAVSQALTAAEPAPTPPAPAAPTTADVSVSIGENGEGSTTVPSAPANASIATQPSSGTASVEAVEGQPDQAVIKVVNATPQTTQVVVVAYTTPVA